MILKYNDLIVQKAGEVTAKQKCHPNRPMSLIALLPNAFFHFAEVSSSQLQQMRNPIILQNVFSIESLLIRGTSYF
jgi:hypothetical protein